MKDSGLSSFLAGLTIGALIGAIIGMLMAPSSGEELRGHVGEFVDERRTAFDDAINEGRAAAELARAELVDAYDEQAAAGETAPEGAAS